MKSKRVSPVLALLLLCAAASGGAAEPVTGVKPQDWMHSDVFVAHANNYRGQGVTVFVVDNFSGKRYWTNLDYWGFATHGEMMRRLAAGVAPGASIFTINRGLYQPAMTFTGASLKVVNLSFGVPRDSMSDTFVGEQYASIVHAANNGLIVTVKAAGNSTTALGGRRADGKLDVLNGLLKSAPSVIFAGALRSNGSTWNKTDPASYSNYAGRDPAYQSRMLFVGVDSDALQRAQGTSAAAAILSGYAAVMGSKFRTASPTQISNQLLRTARQDTIAYYDPVVYGRGEASLSRALAPASLK